MTCILPWTLLQTLMLLGTSFILATFSYCYCLLSRHIDDSISGAVAIKLHVMLMTGVAVMFQQPHDGFMVDR